MKRDDTPSIGEILESLKGDAQFRKQFELAEVWERWSEIAGRRLAAHGQPRGVREATLYVEVDSAVWMHRFGLQKPEILRRINAIAGHELATDLFLMLRDEDEETPSTT